LRQIQREIQFLELEVAFASEFVEQRSASYAFGLQVQSPIERSCDAVGDFFRRSGTWRSAMPVRRSFNSYSRFGLNEAVTLACSAPPAHCAWHFSI